MVTLDEAKAYLRVDHDLDDAYITMLIGAADEYLRGAIDPHYDGVDKQASGETETEKNTLPNYLTFATLEKPINSVDYRAKLLALAVIADWYDNRGTGQTVQEHTRQLVTNFMLQLRVENMEERDV